MGNRFAIFFIICIVILLSIAVGYNLYKNYVTYITIVQIIISFLIISFKFNTLGKTTSLILKDLFTGKFEGLYGLIGFISILTLLSWFADFLKDGNWWLAVASGIDIFIVGAFFIILYPLKPNTKKVLLMALSKPNGNIDKFEQFKENLKQGLLGKRNLELNWELPLRHIYDYRDNLEKVYMLTSPESSKQKEEFLECLDIVLPNFRNKVEFTNPIDFNNFEEIKKELINLASKIKKSAYKDEDIVVNISGGTSMVTLGLTLFALRNGIIITYFEQNSSNKDDKEPSKLLELDVNKEDIF
ncbi:hypothetical protein JCM14244_07840 [Venenivibrio stagnispumantis]|uniref:CRISPR-associated protein (Cas_Cas02710) n=1 Tax=Venenivibrio stagnispumantis TaxID=407998 RepID=A0AA45WNX3_9AQUI|nr:hypothetical protein [Venenivibrio stagnispumantis]MCW4573973.1 hypothetical protein [Venenivibrio stagnispumantis]SMP19151.1 CRISPR-associated protein (Cas_Cas02710) [Venenivibrio stagnispumantis]